MSAIILNGKELAEKIKKELKEEIDRLERKPTLAVILVGNDPASELYVSKKEKVCYNVGIISKKYHFQSNIEEEKIIEIIKNLNKDDSVDGILVQLPLPSHLNTKNILETINPGKDVDGLTSSNFGKLNLGDEKLACCTPKGIIRLLEEYNILVRGQNVVIVNHSNIVGKPLAAMFLNRNATVSICHKFTKDLPSYIKRADILVIGVG